MGVILSEAEHDIVGVRIVNGVESSRKGISPYYPKLLSLPCLLKIFVLNEFNGLGGLNSVAISTRPTKAFNSFFQFV